MSVEATVRNPSAGLTGHGEPWPAAAIEVHDMSPTDGVLYGRPVAAIEEVDGGATTLARRSYGSANRIRRLAPVAARP
ncbi:MAG TPA: hypothetical protein VMW49_02745 [Candidatus Dormibacteraeota bacterium]|nr:hypothetical protein [Candidatus Dormibacteraeota bacterium]